MTLLEVEDLHTSFRTEDGIVRAVDGISFSLERGRVLGIVGESGSGKSVSCLSLLRLTSPRRATVTGRAMFKGRDLLTLPERDLRAVRGREIAMVFQDPMTSLNPVRTIGSQLTEAITLHERMRPDAARSRARDMLASVGIPDPDERLTAYPMQLSGGMRQRVMIAMALINRPDLLIADEPTTALDVTTQAQVLRLIQRLRQETDAAIILITHDLGVIADLCDDVLVLYAGRVVERARVNDLFERPSHPYTWGLLASLPAMNAGARRVRTIPGSPPSLLAAPPGCPFHPRCRFALDRCRTEEPVLTPTGLDDGLAACHLPLAERRRLVGLTQDDARERQGGTGGAGRDPIDLRASIVATENPAPAAEEPILRVEHLVKHFVLSTGPFGGRSKEVVKAVDDVSFEVRRGQTLAVVGESGCGKSTLARCIARLLEPTSGRILFEGRDISRLDRAALAPIRRDLMMIFQDPFGSLNPRMRIGSIIAEPLEIHGYGDADAIRTRVIELLRLVGLNPAHYNRLPHEFSGGQRQRIGIARALALGPKLLICDEPVSALDVSIQAQILNLLADLQDELGLTYVLITHNLDVVRHVADRVLVMYLGRLVEEAAAAELYAQPRHPYTAALLSAVPVPNPALSRARHPIVLEGDVPSPVNPPAACRFNPRCPRAQNLCRTTPPGLQILDDGHAVECHFPVERWPLTDPEELAVVTELHSHGDQPT